MTNECLNIKYPTYLENIDFSANYKPFTDEQKEKAVNEIRAYKMAKYDKLKDKALFIKSTSETMLATLGYVDYAKLTNLWIENKNMISQMTAICKDEKIVLNYYEVLQDMASTDFFGKQIEVQAGSGKLKPKHNKVDDNIKVIVTYEEGMFEW